MGWEFQRDLEASGDSVDELASSEVALTSFSGDDEVGSAVVLTAAPTKLSLHSLGFFSEAWFSVSEVGRGGVSEQGAACTFLSSLGSPSSTSAIVGKARLEQKQN